MENKILTAAHYLSKVRSWNLDLTIEVSLESDGFRVEVINGPFDSNSTVTWIDLDNPESNELIRAINDCVYKMGGDISRKYELIWK
jgi:hypothetical protein